MSALGFWRLAAREPDALATVDPDGSTRTRGELLAMANRTARLLRAQGLRRGDRVLGVVSNESPTLALVLACQQAGAYYVPVNTQLAPAEVAYIVQDAAPVVVVTSVQHAALLHDACEAADFPGARFAFGEADGFRDLLGELAEHSAEPLENRSPGASMGYTSGTTGRPKGVLRHLPEGDPDDVFAAAAQWQLGMFGIVPEEGGVHLVTSPLSHTAVSGLAVTSLHFGHAVVLTTRFDPEETLRVIESQQVTTTHMVPTQLHRLLRLPQEVRERYDVSSMRNLVHGAGPCPEQVKRDVIDWFGPVVWEYYGATEAAGTVISSHEWLERPGSVGRAQPGAEVRILRADGSDLEPDSPGLVFLRMGAHAFEYRGDADKTRGSRIGDFVTVGDLGQLDADGYLYLLGRTAEVIVSGGVNVYPAEIESALLEHPEVSDVGVVAAEDHEWGEAVAAVVQLSEGSPLADDPAAAAAVLVEHLRERVARFKVPRVFRFVDELPRGANGKLRKHLLPSLLEGETAVRRTREDAASPSPGGTR
ncbi:AMP-binding protein [Nocardioides campestrisoli]|uniref:AMP-binding protein n=1 Tax=Nocardioides campestrisoli TaxID=2736757 RepID=UPI00163D668E|nr:AMP-binding protein [Nocardioides campestrisoli]